MEHTPEAELAAAAADPAGAQLSAFTYLGAAALSIGVTMAIVGAVRDRGAALANTGAVLGILGAVGMSAIGIHQLFIAAFAASASPDTLTVLGTPGFTGRPAADPFLRHPAGHAGTRRIHCTRRIRAQNSGSTDGPLRADRQGPDSPC